MALPASGAISFNNVNVELNLSGTATISLNDAAVRTLFAKASGAISMSDGYGKSNAIAVSYVVLAGGGGGGGRALQGGGGGAGGMQTGSASLSALRGYNQSLTFIK